VMNKFVEYGNMEILLQPAILEIIVEVCVRFYWRSLMSCYTTLSTSGPVNVIVSQRRRNHLQRCTRISNIIT
jgi:hypothetical protein